MSLRVLIPARRAATAASASPIASTDFAGMFSAATPTLGSSSMLQSPLTQLMNAISTPASSLRIPDDIFSMALLGTPLQPQPTQQDQQQQLPHSSDDDCASHCSGSTSTHQPWHGSDACAHMDDDITTEGGDEMCEDDSLEPLLAAANNNAAAVAANGKTITVTSQWSDELLDMPIRELNKYIKLHKLTAADVADIKVERRRKKNRTYAKVARIKRKTELTTVEQTHIEATQANSDLQQELDKLREEIEKLQRREAMLVAYLERAETPSTSQAPTIQPHT